MSLSPIALQALRAAQSAFSEVDADLYEDALARGIEAMDREGRIVGAHSAQELERLRARVAELEALNRQMGRRGMRAYAKAVELGRQVETERLPYRERAARETHPGRRQAWLMLAQAEESERMHEQLLAPSVERSVGKLRTLLAPSGDLPQAGGAS